MYKWLVTCGALGLGLALALAALRESPPADRAAGAGSPAIPAPSSPPARTAGKATGSGTAAPPAGEETTQVTAYLQRQADQRRLDAYFANPAGSGESPAEILALIGSLEREGRVLSAEALALKLDWLRVNARDEADYATRSAELLDQYRRDAAAYTREHSPAATPEYADYKAREREIIAEADAMTHFPEGYTRQSWLRERLAQARNEAWGETGPEPDPATEARR